MLPPRDVGPAWASLAVASVLTAGTAAALLSSAHMEPGTLLRAPASTVDRVQFVAMSLPQRQPLPAPPGPLASPAAVVTTGNDSPRVTTSLSVTMPPTMTDSGAIGESPPAGATPARPPGSAPPASAGPRFSRTLSPTAGMPPGPSSEVRLRALGGSVPGLARARGRTTAERDEYWRSYTANQRESRATGRPAAAGDPTKAGAQMGGTALSLPLFSPGPSREKRQRDSLIWKENARLFARLQARLDSLQRAQRDSIGSAPR